MTGDVRAGLPTDAEADALAGAVARAVRLHPVPDPWRPDEAADDSAGEEAAAFAEALAAIGWWSLLEEAPAASLVSTAAVELGRGGATVRSVDCLLGGRPVAGGLVRHGERGATCCEFHPGGALSTAELLALEPVAYGDASGVAVVRELSHSRPVPPEEARRRLELWRAASIGYLAGLAGAAFEDCLAHVRAREAFGTTLDALEPVQSQLADAATALEGVRLLVAGEHSWPALCHAADVAVAVAATCHQLTGALGYTMEYPLQRRSRRARAMRAWAEAAADAAAG